MYALQNLQWVWALAPAIVHADPAVLFGADGQLREACASAVQPANSIGGVFQAQHCQQVECYDVEDLDSLVCPRRCKAATVGAHAHRFDLTAVRAEFFDELDASEVFLPKLDDAIDRARDQKVGVGSEGGEAQLLAVHERLGVAGCAGQGSNIELLIRQLALLLLGRCGGERRPKVVVIVVGRGVIYRKCH